MSLMSSLIKEEERNNKIKLMRTTIVSECEIGKKRDKKEKNYHLQKPLIVDLMSSQI